MATWLDKAIEEKINQGRNEEKHNTARRMLENGIEIDVIVKSTELPKEEIKKLAETIH